MLFDEILHKRIGKRGKVRWEEGEEQKRRRETMELVIRQGQALQP